LIIPNQILGSDILGRYTTLDGLDLTPSQGSKGVLQLLDSRAIPHVQIDQRASLLWLGKVSQDAVGCLGPDHLTAGVLHQVRLHVDSLLVDMSIEYPRRNQRLLKDGLHQLAFLVHTDVAGHPSLVLALSRPSGQLVWKRLEV